MFWLQLIVGFARTQEPLRAASERLGIPFEVRRATFVDQGDGYKVTGDRTTEDALKKYIPLWTQEWAKYPAGLMTKAKVTKIVFAEKLALNGQIRAAVPAFDLNTMYYDPALGSYAPKYQRNVIHHEFFHMIDERMRTLKQDREWAKLNPKGFQYGTGGDKMRTSNVGELTDKIPGFLTLYGTAAVEEDKAELYSHLIVDPEFVTAQAKKDSVLAAKIELLKKRLETYSSVFKAEFWPVAKASQ